MVIRLNPRYPLVWRSPDTIQFGIDRPLVVVPGVTMALERVIAALRTGVPRSGAMMLGRQAGASDAEISTLLLELRPALLTTPETTQETTQATTQATTSATTPETTQATAPATAPETTSGTTSETAPARGELPRITAVPDLSASASCTFPATEPVQAVCVDGQGPTADRLRALFSDLGIPVPATDADPGLAVVIGHYALAPGRHGRWLRRDIPHLPVVFSDSEVRVGPLIEPGTGPCLYCLELTHVDEDPAWPAIAGQLLMREALTETARTSIDVAVRVAGLVQDRLGSGRSELTATSLAIDANTRAVSRRAHRPHERCGCRSLPENVIALAGNAAASQTPPNSSRAVGALA